VRSTRSTATRVGRQRERLTTYGTSNYNAARRAAKSSGAPGLTMGWNWDGVVYLSDRLKAVPEEFRGEMRPQLLGVGNKVKAAAAANSSWSSRIPGSLNVRVSLKGNRMGVFVAARASIAPHARAFEGLSGSPFRHPVYGADRWVDQAARPYLFPAARDHKDEMEKAVIEAVGSAFKRAGVTN